MALRSFQENWFSNCIWLHYNLAEDSVFFLYIYIKITREKGIVVTGSLNFLHQSLSFLCSFVIIVDCSSFS